MQRVLTVELAKLHLLQTTGSVAFFFGRRVVAPFALGAFQNNQFAHFSILSKLLLIISPEPHSGPGSFSLCELPAALTLQEIHNRWS